jgi:hypothetical protein
LIFILGNYQDVYIDPITGFVVSPIDLSPPKPQVPKPYTSPAPLTSLTSSSSLTFSSISSPSLSSTPPSSTSSPPLQSHLQSQALYRFYKFNSKIKKIMIYFHIFVVIMVVITRLK